MPAILTYQRLPRQPLHPWPLKMAMAVTIAVEIPEHLAGVAADLLPSPPKFLYNVPAPPVVVCDDRATNLDDMGILALRSIWNAARGVGAWTVALKINPFPAVTYYRSRAEREQMIQWAIEQRSAIEVALQEYEAQHREWIENVYLPAVRDLEVADDGDAQATIVRAAPAASTDITARRRIIRAAAG